MLAGWLIVTQVMDEHDPNLGFFVAWVRGFARLEITPLHVACWQADPQLKIPGVVIHVLPEGARSRTWALMRLSWQLRKQVSSVFVHMIPPVVVVLGWWWRLLGLRVVLWYTHGTVSWSLRVAEWFVDRILTASEESCRLQTTKKVVVGHGINLDFFHPDATVPREPILLTVGRITPRKDVKTIIDICVSVRSKNPDRAFRAVIVGEPRTESDKAYAKEMRAYAHTRGVDDCIEWTGALFGEALRKQYQRAAVFVTASQTGSLDKVVLESLACGTLVVAKGQTYGRIPGVSSCERTEDMAEAIEMLLANKPIAQNGRVWVEEHASLDRLLECIRAYGG